MKIVRLALLVTTFILVCLGCISCSHVKSLESIATESVEEVRIKNEFDINDIDEAENKELVISLIEKLNVISKIYLDHLAFVYNLFMGDASAIDDKAIESVFVDINKDVIYEAIEDNDGNFSTGMSLFD